MSDQKNNNDPISPVYPEPSPPPERTSEKKLLREVVVIGAIITAIATLITATVGFVTMLVGSNLQERNKRNELALLAYKDFAADQTAAAKIVYEAVGNYLTATEDLIRAKSPLFFTNAEARKEGGLLLNHYNQ